MTVTDPAEPLLAQLAPEARALVQELRSLVEVNWEGYVAVRAIFHKIR